jgi:microcystin-dependent protein
METFYATILWVAFTYAPVGTVEANGQCMAVNSNQALYALVGTRYGGNGTDQFCVPDLRPIGKDGQRDPNWNNGPRAVITTQGLWPSRP